jgi:hypothetical protein
LYDIFSVFWSIYQVSKLLPHISETHCVIFQLVKLSQLVKKGQVTCETVHLIPISELTTGPSVT